MSDMSKTLRISNATYARLVQIQRGLYEQKHEDHKIIAILDKVVTNADVKRLYHIDIDDETDDALENLF